MFTYDNTTESHALSYKNKLETLEECEKVIRDVNVYEYNHTVEWTNKHKDVKSCRKVGPVVEDVAKLLPYVARFVQTSAGESVKHMERDVLFDHLIGAVKHLIERCDRLEKSQKVVIYKVKCVTVLLETGERKVAFLVEQPNGSSNIGDVLDDTLIPHLETYRQFSIIIQTPSFRVTYEKNEGHGSGFKLYNNDGEQAWLGNNVDFDIIFTLN